MTKGHIVQMGFACMLQSELRQEQVFLLIVEFLLIDFS